MNNNIYRIIDANVNRASEGLRVLEDVFRFYYDKEELTKSLKILRHSLRKNLSSMDSKFLLSRDSVKDVGRKISERGEIDDNKTNLKQLITSNFKRVEEALRVIEENLKLVSEYRLSKEVEKIRFESYTLEKVSNTLNNKKLPEGIYAIVTEKYSNGRSNIEVVKEIVKTDVGIIQYREKNSDTSFKKMYEECKEIRKITQDHNVKFIVNDHIELAMMVDADGVHIGQDDYPPSEVRKIIGYDKMLGLSTHSPEQANESLNQAVDYIGVGPIYKTFTKVGVCDPVGYSYLEYVVKNIDKDFVAIGGIKENNIAEIVSRGARTICLVTEIIGSDDIVGKINSLYKIIRDYRNK